MITVTNDVKDFIENQTGEILIYGAGNSGYWVGHYLNRCEIEFSGYIDNNELYCGALCQEKPVYQPQKLSEYKGRNLRLIISPRLYESILSDIMFSGRKYGFHALCLVPRFMHFSLKQEVYDINHFLGYFRRGLYKKDTPTIISNDCVSGEIYNLMDMPMLSPTINTYIAPSDFLKLCKDPERYFDIEGKELFYNVLPIGDEPEDCKRGLPAIKVDDITITFAHTEGKSEELVERWNMMRKRINWDNLIFIFRINHMAVPEEFIRDFAKLKRKKLIMNYGANGVIYRDIEQLFFSEYILGKERAVENSFELLEWLNKEAPEQEDDE